ncbi:ubiquitin thioesterase OTUB1-like [Styela clava]|uniref:ubiquitin thioesterase OTUB1-like n=1 Tax=Styela clava TaxID=7725 RepID=UPI001939C0A7|nr:ubiquitin thioesterase OTUB1-like [Styela clava]
MMATSNSKSDEEVKQDTSDSDGAILQAMQNQEIDEAIYAMHNQIQKDIAKENELVSDKMEIMQLQNEYAEDDAVYLQKVKILSEKYSHVRKTRGDGNCFYRAFGFGYLEYLLQNKDCFSGFRAKASETKDKLEKLGYPSFTVEDFHDQFISVVDSVGSGITVEELLQTFRDEGISNYLVVYLRLVTSSHLQQNSEFFQNFVDEYRTVEDFCKGEVEPMDRESDHIHIIATTTALNLSIRVAYVDRTNSEEIIYHDFPEGSRPQLHLLYRPGHYDILYPR